MAQLPSKTFNLFLAVVVRLVVWYCWHAWCRLRLFPSTHSIIRSVQFSRRKCSSHSTDTSPQGTATPNQHSRHQVDPTHSFLPRTPFIYFSHHSPYKSSFDTSRYNVDTPSANTTSASVHCGLSSVTIVHRNLPFPPGLLGLVISSWYKVYSVEWV